MYLQMAMRCESFTRPTYLLWDMLRCDSFTKPTHLQWKMFRCDNFTRLTYLQGVGVGGVQV